MRRLNFEQAANFRRACWLNNPRSLSDLRAPYQSCLSGQQFGLRSGYPLAEAGL